MEPPLRFDLLVLGGGAAGCVLAARLSADPQRRVCLVEAGPDPGRLADGGWPSDVLDSHQLPVSHDWRYDDGFAWSARIVGGCSAHNACILTWGSQDDYDEWGEGWSATMLAPYRRRAELAIGLRLGRERAGAWHEAVLDAAVAAGFARVDDLNADDAVLAAGMAPLNDRDGVRWNAALAYLDEARGRPNLAILDRTLVDRVDFASGRAIGARLVRDGRSVTVAADTVVVAAGAYGSPAILLRSGVGPERDLAALGIEPVAVREGVGQNLVNHWTARVLLEPGADLAAATAAEHATGGAYAAGALIKAAGLRCPPEAWDMHLFAICWGIRDEQGRLTGEHVFRIATAAMKPKSRGSLRLASADPLSPPRIDHAALSDAEGHDLATLTDGIRLAREIAACDPLFGRGVREVAPDGVADDSAESHVRATLGCYFHPVGTCRIGAAGDPLAVVNGEGAVHGCAGLYVADASIMPTIPRANTHLTTLAVAERIAESLLAEPGRSAVRPGE